MKTTNRKVIVKVSLLSLAALSLIILQGSASPKMKNQVPPVAVEKPQAEIKLDKIKPITVSTSMDFKCPAMPIDLEFCGEKVPMEDFNVKERLDRELTVNTYWHSNTMLMFKRAKRFFPSIEMILKEEGVPDDFKYLAMAESGLMPVTSSAGAQGLWQFISSTGKRYGLEINGEIDERYHLEKSTRAACKYLKNAKKEFGTWSLAAAAYNRGEGGLDRALESQKVSSYYDLYLNSETSRYVFRIIALKEIHQNLSKYNFNLCNEDLYEPIPTETVIVSSSVNWPEFALSKGTTYKILRDLNPWIHSYSLNSSGKRYEVLIPVTV